MAAHTATLNERAGVESGAMEELQQKHAEAIADLKQKIDLENKAYLETLRESHEGEIKELNDSHYINISELETELKTLQGKYDTEITALQNSAGGEAETLKAVHTAEIQVLEEKHAQELKDMENITKVTTHMQVFFIGTTASRIYEG